MKNIKNPPGFDHLHDSGLVVPANIAAERIAARDAERERWEAEAESRQKRENRPAEQTQVTQMLLPAWHSGPITLRKHRLYSINEVDEALRRNSILGSRDAKVQKQASIVLAYMRELGAYRCIAKVRRGWRKLLAALLVDHPNFEDVIIFIAGELAIAAATGEPVHLPPILLNGPSGVGKTSFAQALADVLQSGFLRINMETAQTSAALAGTDEHWSNSKPGQLFSTLIDGEFANPVVLVDELDKARVSSNSGYDPASGLYGLLEPSSAKAWHDLAIPAVKLDASKVIWIVTSNWLEQISSPLCSRMRIFEIPRLKNDQARAVVSRIFASQARALKKMRFSTELPEKMAMLLALSSPREMHRVCRELIAKAILAGRRHVIQQDLNDIALCDNRDGHVNSTVRVSVETEIPIQISPTLH